MQAGTSSQEVNDAVFAVWRAESARLIGALTRMTRDVDLAEDLAQDALVAALEQWPATGAPENPAGWLMTTAKRRGIDHYRRADSLRSKIAELERMHEGEEEMPDIDSHLDYVEDDVLRLIFLACHSSLSAESRAALTLRLVGGLTTAEIARGFLTTESTMGQRISRAKKTLSAVHAEFELPTVQERTERLDDVMAVIYLIFNEGYSATSGQDWMRPDLAAEAIRLARMLAALAPHEPEVLGLQALLEIQGSRLPARIDEEGLPVLLEAQDRTRWDHLLIRRGTTALQQARRLAEGGTPVGRYFLQALIAAEHARARLRRHPMGSDRSSLRRPGGFRPWTDRRSEPSRGPRESLRSRGRSCRPGEAGRRRPRGLTARTERPRRPSRASRAPRAGKPGIHGGGGPHQERGRTRSAPSPRRAEPDAHAEFHLRRGTSSDPSWIAQTVNPLRIRSICGPRSDEIRDSPIFPLRLSPT